MTDIVNSSLSLQGWFTHAPGMPSKKAGYAMRLWVSNDDIERLKKLSQNTELSQVDLMTHILHSGLVCAEQNEFRLMFPLKFTVAEDSYSAALMNDTRRKK